MQDSTPQRSPIMTWLLIAVLLLGVFALYNQHQNKKECEDRALAAAVDEYGDRRDLNTSQRQVLEESYQASYMQTCN